MEKFYDTKTKQILIGVILAIIGIIILVMGFNYIAQERTQNIQRINSALADDMAECWKQAKITGKTCEIEYIYDTVDKSMPLTGRVITK